MADEKSNRGPAIILAALAVDVLCFIYGIVAFLSSKNLMSLVVPMVIGAICMCIAIIINRIMRKYAE